MLGYLRNHQHVQKHWKHPGLRQEVHDVLHQLHPDQWSIHKVFSHEDLAHAPTALEEWLVFLLEVATHTLEHKCDVEPDDESLLLSAFNLQWSPNSCDLSSQFPLEGITELHAQKLGGFTVQFCDSVHQYLSSLDFEAHQERFVTGLELLAVFLIPFDGSIPLARVEHGIHVRGWSIRIGWPHDVNSSVTAVLSEWFAHRPYRKACDLTRPLPQR